MSGDLAYDPKANKLAYDGHRHNAARRNPRLKKAWTEAYKRGIAGDLCDRIVRVRDVPPALVWLYESSVSETRVERVLTRREREVLFLVSLGWPDRNVGAALAISVHTVNMHLRNIRKSLGASNGGSRAELVAIAYRRGEIQ